MDFIADMFEDDETEVVVGQYITYDVYVVYGNNLYVRRTEHMEYVNS